MQVLDKHTDLMSWDDLQGYLALRGEPCVSIYLPTHRVTINAQQDQIRLKNLLRDAENQLIHMGLRTTGMRDLLAPAYDLLGRQKEFWFYQSDGLALFMAPGYFSSYRLPLQFDERSVVGTRFYVKPLLRMFADDGHFYVLTLSQGGVTLLKGTRYRLSEIDLGDVPHNLAEALRYDDFEHHLQYHTSGWSTIFHGHGAADGTLVKENILRFFCELDNGVRDLLAEDAAPLVLAGVEFIRGLYRRVNHYALLVEEGIDDHPENLSRETLHRRAWAIVEPLFQQARQRAADAYQHLAGIGHGRAVNTLEATVRAAYYRRIDTLFAPDGQQHWGTFDSEAGEVRVYEKALTGHDDLLDFVVVHTLLNAGTVHLVDPADMPDDAPVAAILRY